MVKIFYLFKSEKIRFIILCKQLDELEWFVNLIYK